MKTKFLIKWGFIPLLLCLVAFFIWAPNILAPSTASIYMRRNFCLHNLQNLSKALSIYAQGNNLEFPPPNGAKGLLFLREYISNLDIYNCIKDQSPNRLTSYFSKFFAKETKKSFQTNYVYLGGFRKDTKPPMPLLFDKLGNHKNYCNVLFSDGRIEGGHFKYSSYDDFVDFLGKRIGYDVKTRQMIRAKIAEALRNDSKKLKEEE